MNVLLILILALFAGAGGILLSSGDGLLLVLAKLCGVSELPIDLLSLAILLHIGNLLAVLLFYRRELAALLRELLRLVGILRTPRAERKHPSLARRELLMVLLALVPMLLCIAFWGLVRSVYGSEFTLLIVGLLLIVNGAALFLSERFYRGHKDERSLTPLDALLIGFAQAFTVFPGLSRAGLTVSVGVLRGLRRDYALRFSSLLSVPVLLAALIAMLCGVNGGSGALPNVWLCLLGVTISTAVSYGALRLLANLSEYRRNDVFAYWCWGAGILSLILLLIT